MQMPKWLTRPVALSLPSEVDAHTTVQRPHCSLSSSCYLTLCIESCSSLFSLFSSSFSTRTFGMFYVHLWDWANRAEERAVAAATASTAAERESELKISTLSLSLSLSLWILSWFRLLLVTLYVLEPSKPPLTTGYGHYCVKSSTLSLSPLYYCTCFGNSTHLLLSCEYCDMFYLDDFTSLPHPVNCLVTCMLDRYN